MSEYNMNGHDRGVGVNTKTLPAETVVIELEPWEARRLHTALARINRSKVVGKSEFALSEKVVMRKILEGLRN